jgi:hypothetical protein
MKWIAAAIIFAGLLGFGNVLAFFQNTGTALANASGGFEPGYGLPQQVALPLCKDGWSDIVEIPIGKSYVYTSNVTPVVQKQWLGRWETVPANDMSPNQAVRFCTNDLFGGAKVELVWSNL